MTEHTPCNQNIFHFNIIFCYDMLMYQYYNLHPILEPPSDTSENNYCIWKNIFF